MTFGKSYWIKSGKFSLFERISNLLFGVLTFYLLVRIIEKDQYGTWILYMTIVNLVDMARHGFFRNPLIRLLNLKENYSDNLTQSTSLALNLLTSTGISIILFLLSFKLQIYWESPQLVNLFCIHLINNVGLTLFYHFDYILKANFRFLGASLGYMTRSLVFFAFVLYFYFSNTVPSLFTLGLCFLGASIISAFIMYIAVNDLIKISLKIDKRIAGNLVGYGKYTLATSIGAVLLRNIDVWMIGFFLNPVFVASYNVAVRIANLFEVPTNALASILFPKAVERVKDEGEKVFKKMYEKSVAAILFLIIPFITFVILYSEEIVIFLAGEEYLDSADILRITMLYGIAIPFVKQMGILLEAIGKAKINMIFVFRDALINLILNSLLIPKLGVMGAAYATLTTFTLAIIMNQIFMYRRYNVFIKDILLEVYFFAKELFQYLKNLK